MQAETATQGVAPVEVAIVGYGPVGATLAGLLGRAGIPVAVFERADAIFAQPRAVGFDHDAMRLFQRIGIADALSPHVTPFRDTVFLGADGAPIQRVRPIAPPYPLGWTPSLSCDQPGLEAVLRRAVDGMPSVRVALGAELLRLEQGAHGVRFDVRHADGRVRTHATRWLIGCDGASSTVRRQCGIALDSLDYDKAWIVVDAQVEPAMLERLPSTNVQYCEPERPSTYIVCPGTHRRWEFMLVAGESRDDALTPDRLWALLARWLKPGEAHIWRAAAYRFHALIARQWRDRRVLLAGDAAHQTPPFLGQGMCQGLRDAGNLAWKLEQVLRGALPEAAQDSYQAERGPHVEQTTRLARDFGHLMTERDPLRARDRDLRLRARAAGSAPVLVRQDLIPGLSAGLIAAGAKGAGLVFPQPRVRDAEGRESLLDDRLGPVWRIVIGLGFDEAERADLLALAHAVGLPLQWVAGSGAVPDPDGALPPLAERDGVLAHWLRPLACRGALVRPDHYVYGAFDTPADARRLVRTWLAATRPTSAADADSDPAAATTLAALEAS